MARFFRTLLQSFFQLMRGKRQILLRIPFGYVAQAQFDRVDADLFGKHIHRAFKRRHSHRFSRCAHRSGRHEMDAGDLEHQFPIFAAVDEM